jgi:hypothetical protein
MLFLGMVQRIDMPEEVAIQRVDAKVSHFM